MVKIKSLFVSDLHLGVKYNKSDRFLEVLDTYEFQNLFLVGDIIDFVAIKQKLYWKKYYGKIFKKIIDVSSKSDIIYITGNHDAILRQFTPFKNYNITICDEYIYNNKLIIHGDKFDSLMGKIRHFYMFGNYSYDIVIWLDYFCGFNGQLCKKTKKQFKQMGTYLNRFYKTAEKYTSSKGCSTVICGHLHNQEYKKLGNIDYYNCGNFREDCDYLIENLDGSLELKT